MSCRRASIVACMLLGGCTAPFPPAEPPRTPEVLTNDNTAAAGRLRDGVLTLDLVAGQGRWFPERDQGPAHEVYVFGERGQPLRNPGPMIRVPVGTEIRVTIRNSIADAPLTVHGLHDRPGSPDPLTVGSGAVDSVRFRVSAPGTYFYWGTTRGAKALRDRWGMESQLLGALIVDSSGTTPPEHVFVIAIEDDSGAAPVLRHLRAAVINGLSWPHGGQHTATQGDTVRTRWINASDRFHPIHLHGFYFQVESRGDMASDTVYDDAARRVAVTELLMQGQTMTASWVAERPGNWLMHCHMTEHMGPELRSRPPRMHDDTHNHSMEAMAGLVAGWRVAPVAVSTASEQPREIAADPRKVRLLVQSAPARYGSHPALGFVLQAGDGTVKPDSVVVPGPPLVLTRGHPVEITVVNRLAEPTSIHWHGIELDSYFDGVSGWSGTQGSLAPHIAPGDSFAVRFTPPRAGTFIYHTHFSEERQLSSGMYGPLIVLEPGASHDPDTDRVLVLGKQGPGKNPNMLLNGRENPSFEMRAGQRYRMRIININPNVPLRISLGSDTGPVRWRAIAKDGADLPARLATVRPASLWMGVGETYDFEFIPEPQQTLVFKAASPEGHVRVASVIHVR